MAKIGGSLEENLSLVEGFADELVLFVVELKDGLLKIADASVDELGGLGRGSCGRMVR